jgi:uncharacterized membrane protein
MDTTPGIRPGDSALRRAKQPSNPAAGPYGHPFHPILVTVPIGAWVASLVFDIVAQAKSGADAAVFAEGAYWLVGIGIVGAVLAALFGLMDLLGIERGTRAFKTGLTHMALNVVVLVLFIVDFVIRASKDHNDPSSAGLVITIIALVLLGASGWLGGMLAYTFGVRVADETHQAEGFRAS